MSPAQLNANRPRQREHPTLPDALGVRRVQDEAGRSLTRAQGRFSDGLQELRILIGSAHSQFAQQRREWIAVLVGAMLGLLIWYPLVWLIP